MKPAEVRKQIASGATGPLYLLEGDDPQSRHDLANEFAQIVDEGLHAFNVQSFFAIDAATPASRDAMMLDILSAARTLPMMSPRRVLIVHDAERLLSPRKAKDEDPVVPDPVPAAVGKRRRATTPSEDFERYLDAPELQTTIVFDTGPLDGNRRLVRLLRAKATAVQCGTLASAADAAKWIKGRVEKEGLSIEPQAVNLLLQATGLGLGAIRAEVEKLVLFASGESAITTRHVKDMVLPSSEPGEDFALGRAIWNSNARAAITELEALFESGAVPVMVLGQVRAATRRLRPDERVRRGLDAVFEADLAIKSSVGDPRHVIERLVIELCER